MEIDDIKTLLALMKENDLAEIEVDDGDRRIRLVKAGSGVREVMTVQAPMAMGHMQTMAAQGTAGSAPAAPVAEPEPANIHIIKAPMVGTFYKSPSPDSDPFTDVGMQVADDTTVCIIEAMKVMNEIRAEVAGTILEVFVENGHPVEYGQPLFKVQLEE